MQNKHNDWTRTLCFVRPFPLEIEHENYGHDECKIKYNFIHYKYVYYNIINNFTVQTHTHIIASKEPLAYFGGFDNDTKLFIINLSYS